MTTRTPPRIRPEHANVWIQFACAALGGHRASEEAGVEYYNAEEIARWASNDADAMLAEWLKRFPEEVPLSAEKETEP